MIELAGGAGLLLEAIDAAGVGGERLRNQLEGDLPAKTRIACALDLAHPASTEPADDLIRSDSRAGCNWHGSRGS